jgi:hypothetical protein
MGGPNSDIAPDHVTVFFEDDGISRRAAGRSFTPNGRLEFGSLEPTRRTRYYSDLVDLGALVKSWKNHSELIDRVLARAGVTD